MTTSVTCQFLNLDTIRKTPLLHEPYDYVIVPNVISREFWAAIGKDFPKINKTGSFPIDTVSYGPAFQQLVDELLSKQFEQIVSEKFNLPLDGMPQMLTVRGWCGWKADGHVHTDSKDKVITVLLYLNETWDANGGNLRVLNSKNVEDYAAEIPPVMGQLLMFRRCDYSWHGHLPCEGERRSMQLNWVASTRYKKFEHFRHKFSSLFKRGGAEY